MKIIINDWRSHLNSSHLESLLRIKIEGPCLINFSNNICEETVKHWWNEKKTNKQEFAQKSFKKRLEKNKRIKFLNEFVDLSSSSYQREDVGFIGIV